MAVVFLTALTWASLFAGVSQTDGGFIGELPASVLTPAISADSQTGSAKYAFVDTEALSRLPDGTGLDIPISINPTMETKLSGNIKRIQSHPNGVRTFLGEMTDVGTFGFAVSKVTVVGAIQCGDGRQYQLSQSAAAQSSDMVLTTVTEKDAASFRPCGLGHSTTSPALINSVPTAPTPSLSSTQSTAGCDASNVVDLLVLYTNVARVGAGGTQAIEAYIQMCVDFANFVFANSLVELRFNVVHIAETQYDENSTFSGHLENLVDPRNGLLDEAHVLREQYKADLVCLFVEDNEVGGMAYMVLDEAHGFSVVSRNSGSLETLAHETGHNLGCAHDRQNSSYALTPYAYGYRFYGTNGLQNRTVMAYAPGNIIPYFSNPNVMFNGVPAGAPLDSPEPAYNALVVSDNRSIIANYRISGSADCNANTLPDGDDLQTGRSVDTDGNGIPDECQRTLYVDADAPAGGNGSSWATAYKDLNAALSAVTSCSYISQIWVAEGTYKPAGANGNRSASFILRPQAALYGGFAGTEQSLSERDWAAHPTILSGDLNSNDQPTFVNRADNSYHIVQVPRNFRWTTLDGFIIRGGNADLSNSSEERGAGINANDAPVKICNCIIEDCYAYYSGAAAYLSFSPAVIENCTVRRNKSPRGGGITVMVVPEVIHITDCSFQDNYADLIGGAIWSYGNQVPINLTHCAFTRNSVSTSSGRGGAVTLEGDSVTITRCRFEGNRSRWGGALDLRAAGTTPTHANLSNCDFVGNYAAFGGAAYNAGSFAGFSSCDMLGNTGSWDGAVLRNYQAGTMTLANCILWFNTYPTMMIYDDTVVTAVTYSNLEASRTGVGNIRANPLFTRVPAYGADKTWGTADDDYGDLRLQATSPCIDAGNNLAVPSGILQDLAGNVRILDYPAMPNTGNPAGSARIVDMGSYELVSPLPGDFDQDGDIDNLDINAFITCASGPAIPFATGCSSRDLDHDGDADHIDFAVMQRCISDTGRAVEANCGS